MPRILLEATVECLQNTDRGVIRSASKTKVYSKTLPPISNQHNPFKKEPMIAHKHPTSKHFNLSDVHSNIVTIHNHKAEK